MLERLSASIDKFPEAQAQTDENTDAAFERSKERHLAICAEQVAYVGSLPLEHILGYLALRRELKCMLCLSTSNRFSGHWQAKIPRAAASMPARFGAQFFWALWWAPRLMERCKRLQWRRTLATLRARYSVEMLPERHCANVVQRQLAWLQATVEENGFSNLPEHPRPPLLHRSVAARLSVPQSPSIPSDHLGFVAEGSVLRDVPFVVQVAKSPRTWVGWAEHSHSPMHELAKELVLLYEFKPRPRGHSARNLPRRDPRPKAAEGILPSACESDFVLTEFKKVLDAWKVPYAEGLEDACRRRASSCNRGPRAAFRTMGATDT